MKNKYSQLCEEESTIPVFSQPWWLDAVCGPNDWDVVLVEKGGKIWASMPYYMPRRDVIAMPQLTQTMGPWIRKGDGKYSKELSRQKEFMFKLIDQLPETKKFTQQFHHSITNWLPFYWKGFQQTTRYTYVIDDLSSESQLWDNLDGKVRSDIKKAGKRFRVTVMKGLGDGIFVDVHRKTFERQGLEPPNPELVKQILQQCRNLNCGCPFFAQDNEGNIHAVSLMLWNDQSAYYLLGSGDPKFRKSGAQSLIMWEMIKHASKVSQRFDFEGSMIEPIERHFRSFGAKQYRYFRIFYDKRTRKEKVKDRVKNNLRYRINKLKTKTRKRCND